MGTSSEVICFAGTQYHVTVRYPVMLKINGAPARVLCFDATCESSSVGFHDFRVVCVWLVEDREKASGLALRQIKITQMLTIPADNVAGIVAQPFSK